MNASLTLHQVADATGIDVGQLSRFERGDFKRMSANLQRYLAYLQTRRVSIEAPGDAELTAAVLRLAARSARHRAAAHAVLEALDSLG